jgi:hypothetical protein
MLRDGGTLVALLQDHEGKQLYAGIENPIDYSNYYRSLSDPTYDIGDDPRSVAKLGPLRVWVADQLGPPIEFFPVGSPVERSFLTLLERWAASRGILPQDMSAIIARDLTESSSDEERHRHFVLEMVLILKQRTETAQRGVHGVERRPGGEGE